VNDPVTTRPLADDADFLESLSELDRGLPGDRRSVNPRRSADSRRRTPVQHSAQPPALPAWLAPSAVAAVSAASAAISEALDLTATDIRGASRPLRKPDPELVLERAPAFAFEPDLAPSETSVSWRDRAVFALVIVLLMLAGAGGAAWTFREPLSRVVAQWQGR
jgi:hypothetical protein